MQKLSRSEIDELLKDAGGWKFSQGKFLKRKFRFRNFLYAMRFANKVAKIANRINHHPDILVHNYNEVLLTLSSHKVRGVTERDFIMAKAINRLR